MPPRTVRVERRGPRRILTIDRPAVRNCIDSATVDGIASAIEAFGRDDDARVLVVTGAGTEAFCAGADLRDIEGLMLRPQGERTAPLRFSWLDPGKPTSGIEGYCVGGGMELGARRFLGRG